MHLSCPLPCDDAFMPASRVYLPRLEAPPASVLEYLCARFPQISASTWLDRMARGLVMTDDGTAIDPASPYRQGVTVLYFREVASEPAPAESETVLYRDLEILVADKPHGMPVTPAGEYVERSLLQRLESQLDLAEIAPLHRLDRDTAGIVLFSLSRRTRGQYHALFSTRSIEREYLAVARINAIADQQRWRVENRLGTGHPWIRQQIVEGPINAITEIELLEIRDGNGLFRLRPQTGRKHQLRIHMASLGFPILGDPLYPEVREKRGDNPPMQLLAARLSFVDPLTSARRDFASTRRLTMWVGE
jgi:tRNA pseudouridine32 synthase/23S rRNA pseudouridine746 synthase